MIKLPRLFVDGKFERIMHPISLSITENIVPLSTASITLPKDEELPPRSYVELFTPYGSAGMFRVRSPKNAYGNDTTTAELEHMISEVGDYVVKEDISEMMYAKPAIEKVFHYYEGGLWKLGSITALGSSKVACEVKYDRILDSMLEILEQVPDCMMTFNFNTKPWTINIVKKDTAVSAEGRLARNVSSATVTYDDTELVTRLWYETFDSNKKSTWKFKDASTKKTYGIVEGTVRTSSDMTSEEITTTVDTYLEEHKYPKVSISIQADELANITGEKLDKFTIGKLMRLAIPEYGLTVDKTITSITWSDVYGNPRSVTVNLGDEEDTVVTFLHNLDSTGSGGTGGGKNKDNDDKAWSEYIVQWDEMDDKIVGMVAKQDRTGSILEQAGLTLNSKGLLVYAKTKDGLQSKFNVLNDKITTSVENAKKGLQSEIVQTADSITATVKNVKNGLQSQITQTATQIRSEVTNSVAGLQSSITQTATQIRAEVSDTAAGLSSSITQTATQIRSEVSDTASGLQSQITQNAGEISLKVSKNGVISSINQTAEQIKIQASKIALDGQTIASLLDAEDVSVDSITADTAYIPVELNAQEASVFMPESVRWGNYDATWKSLSFIRVTNVSESKRFLYAGSTGTTPSGAILSNVVTTYTNTTIHYLGR